MVERSGGYELGDHVAADWLIEWSARLFDDRFGRTPSHAAETTTEIVLLLRNAFPQNCSPAQRAAGWRRWVTMMIGYVHLLDRCPRIVHLAAIAQDAIALSARGTEVLRRLRAREPTLPVRAGPAWPIARTRLDDLLRREDGLNNHPLHNLPENLSELPDPWLPLPSEAIPPTKPEAPLSGARSREKDAGQKPSCGRAAGELPGYFSEKVGRPVSDSSARRYRDVLVDRKIVVKLANGGIPAAGISRLDKMPPEFWAVLLPKRGRRPLEEDDGDPSEPWPNEEVERPLPALISPKRSR